MWPSRVASFQHCTHSSALLKGWKAAAAKSVQSTPMHTPSLMMSKLSTGWTPSISMHFPMKKSSPQAFQGSCFLHFYSPPWKYSLMAKLERTSKDPNIMGKSTESGTELQLRK